MKRGDWIWPFGTLVVILVASVFVSYPPSTTGDVAAWLQAIGSIAAIVGAYIIGERQSIATLESVREAHRITEFSKRASRFAVVNAAHKRAKLFEAALADESPPLKMIDVYHSSIIDSLVLAMNNIPVSELGSDEAVDAFIIFSGQFVFLRMALDKYMAGPYQDPDVKKTLDELSGQHSDDAAERRDFIVGVRQLHKLNVIGHLRRIDIEFRKLERHFQPHQLR